MHEARTLHAANKRLCRLRGSPQDFSRVPAAILYGDFHQFRPVAKTGRSRPSSGGSTTRRTRYRRFTTVIMLDKQIRAAGDPELRRLLGGSAEGGRTQAARDFLSKNKQKEGAPMGEEAVLVLGYDDDSATPVPAVLVFVPGMPVVINQNTHQGLKPVNGARYTVVDAKMVKLDYQPDD
ncbi:hypothetical protein HRG_010020 [Hirsutella rhossiliensis]|uniref:ATP-dependent DNA helicase n=1 Tax=Hirsutella rhossiliensis TaxID=111463 RepID=A0A9P8MPM3_9HYPO|nr:uncharacterized protein HRG_10020 [Hirsutella rhossiliensis]KAH0958975.1 hypothetical protein HRG_10020 [Hirsutella rhossiliensis]